MALSEYQECVELAIWLDRRKILYTHVPNGGKRDKREAANFRRMGVKPGVPDYLIFTPPPGNQLTPSDDVCIGVAIEMKSTKDTAKTAPLQRRWLDRLSSIGWLAVVCVGHRDAIDILTRLRYDYIHP